MMKLLPADSLANKISFYHLLLLLVSLPFNFFYSHFILISFAVHTLIQLNKQRFLTVFKWKTLLLQSVFIVTIITALYSVNKPGASSQVGLHLPILFIPVVFALSGFDFKKYREPLLLGFSVVCTLVILYLFGDAIRIIHYYHFPFLKALFSVAFTNHHFSEPINMHATFFSMQLVIAVVYLLTVLVSKHAAGFKIFCGVCCAILMAGLFQLCSKSVLFTLFTVIIVAFPLFYFHGKLRLKFAIGALALTLIAGLSAFQVKAFKQRYYDELKADFAKPVAGESIEPRLARWDVATELIKASPITGHGAGSETDILHDAFYQKKYYNSFLNNLNAHNQYLSFLLQSGILGLIVYLITLFYGFKYALQKKDLLFLTFVLLLAIVSLSEDYLAVDKGVFFYAIFFSFFVFSDADNASKRTDKQQDNFSLTGNLQPV